MQENFFKLKLQSDHLLNENNNGGYIMSKIIQRGKSISIVFYLGKGDERTQKWEAMPNKIIAELRLQNINKGLSDGSLTLETYVKPTKDDLLKLSDYCPTLRDYMTYDFIPKYGLRKWGHSYYRMNLSRLENYIYPKLKDIRLDEFKVMMIDEFYQWLLTECAPVDDPKKKGLPASTVSDIHKVLRCAFNKAKKWQLIDSNPFLDATPPDTPKVVRETLSTRELEELLKETDDPSDYDKYTIHVALNIAFACSLRGGELAALQWSDFDLPNSFKVFKSIDRIYKDDIGKCTDEIYFTFPQYSPFAKTCIVLKNTKTEGSVRRSYFGETIKKKLETLRELQNTFKEMLGNGYSDYGLVICQAHGRPLMTEHINKKFKKALAALEMKEVVFHSLRSTSTTFKLKVSGGDIKTIQGENGHADPRMVIDQYARIVDEDRKYLADKVESVFYQGNNDERLNNFINTISSNRVLLEQLIEIVDNQ